MMIRLKVLQLLSYSLSHTHSWLKEADLHPLINSKQFSHFPMPGFLLPINKYIYKQTNQSFFNRQTEALFSTFSKLRSFKSVIDYYINYVKKKYLAFTTNYD